MSDKFAEEFSKLGIVITPHVVNSMRKLVLNFELRRDCIEALNTPLLGVYPMSFRDEDTVGFYNLFGIRREEQISSLVKNIPVINPSFIVTSNPFNLLSIWVIHLAFSMIKDKRSREEFVINVAKYMHYRFFTSLVRHFYPHGAKESFMQYTVNNLTKRFSIIQYETWRGVITARGIDFVGKDSIHLPAFISGAPDEKILYAISDAQTRLRDIVKNVTAAYYENIKHGREIRSTSSVSEIDGEKILSTKVNQLDAMISSLMSDVMNVRTFIERGAVDSVAKGFSSLRSKSLSVFLTNVSHTATNQSKSGLLNREVYTDKDQKLDVPGIGLLIRDIIKSSHRYCIRAGISMDRHDMVYRKTRDAFASSRISDEDIKSVKDRVELLVNYLVNTNREATKASMRLAFIMYIVYRGLKSVR